MATELYDPERIRDFAATVAQIVPVLLLAALAVPLRSRRTRELDAGVGTESVATGRDGAAREVLELLATAGLIGGCFLTEFFALYGVYYTLNRNDAHRLVWLVLVTGLFALWRILLPVAAHYSERGGISEKQAWFVLAGTSVLVFVGALALMS
jgi:hypothetical protein